MKDTKDVVACVVDQGMFMPMAVRLAEDVKKVYYYTPWEKGFASISDCILGDGLDNIERLDDFLSPSVFDKIDLFVFPNLFYAGLQHQLEAVGKAVWGSRDGDKLELFKDRFYQMLSEVGLEVPPHQIIIGMSKLRRHLMEHEDLWVKMDKYRATMDTWHHSTYEESRGYLDILACKLGPFQDFAKFYLIDPIETKIEGGIDNYCIDGEWPNFSVLGYEKKNKTYLATVRPTAKMAPEFLEINKVISPVLADLRYRNWFSTEIRVKGETSFFIDPTCRMPSPAGEEQLEIYKNIGDIVWYGAQGVMCQPEISKRFCGESLIHHMGDKTEWKAIKVPKEVRRWVKLYACAQIEDTFYFPPDDEEVIGCIVGVGNTIEAVIDQIESVAVEINGSGNIEVDTGPFGELLECIDEGEKLGVEFYGNDSLKPADAQPVA